MLIPEHEIRLFLRDRGLSPETLNLIYLLEILVDAAVSLEFAADPPARPTIRGEDTVFPLKVQKLPVGQIRIERPVEDPLKRTYIRSVVRNLERILEKNCALLAFERERDEAAKERQFLLQILPLMGRVTDEREVCGMILRRLLKIMPVDRASIMLVTEHHTLRMIASKGIPKKYAENYEAPIAESVSGIVVETGQPLRINDEREINAEFESRMLSRRGKKEAPNGKPAANDVITPLVIVPIRGARRVIGVLSLSTARNKRVFSEDDVRFLEAIVTPMGTAIENSRHVATVTEAERVQREMEVAGEIQQSLLPTGPLELGDLSAKGRCRPATDIGGDYFHYFARNGRIHLLIGDVAGHGIASALLMTIFRSAYLGLAASDHDPATLLTELNRAVFADFSAKDSFVTCIYLQAEKDTGRVRMANAGHSSPIIYSAQTGTLRELPGSGVPAGLMTDSSYKTIELSLDRGDRLVLYTDGVIEAGKGGEVTYDVHALMRALSQHLATEREDDVAEIVMDEATGHYPRGVPDDDMTLVVLARRR